MCLGVCVRGRCLLVDVHIVVIMVGYDTGAKETSATIDELQLCAQKRQILTRDSLPQVKLVLVEVFGVAVGQSAR